MSSAAIRSTVRVLRLEGAVQLVLGGSCSTYSSSTDEFRKKLFREAWQQARSPNRRPFLQIRRSETEFTASYLSVEPAAGIIDRAEGASVCIILKDD